MTHSFFITSTGTGVGKTLVTCRLGYQLTQMGKKVSVLKPVISGWEDTETNDTQLLLKSIGHSVTQDAIERVSPWRLIAPLAPSLAAAQEGKILDFQAIVRHCQNDNISDVVGDYQFIEGVGGVMVPLTKDKHMLDLMRILQYPVILVVGSYLGSVSHTLTALLALQNYQICVAGIVVSESDAGNVGLVQTVELIQDFCNIPIVCLPRIVAIPGEPKWESGEDLLSLVM